MVGCLAAFLPAVAVNAPAAYADDMVTYEVFSADVPIANIEYQDITGRIALNDVQLPWRADIRVRSVRGAPPDGSQVRADWRPGARPFRWVTVRVISEGKVICESTLDIGNATCYGITPRVPQ
ncbi:MAG: hypothetical protein HYZ38_10385 [Mycobacterium sp.]|nr:hypothetical protein [Mycobacterium sp.]